VLLYLGGRALLAAWRHRAGAAEAVVVPAPDRRAWWSAFGEGVAVQLANPKAAVFMMAFYPQFVPSDRPLFLTTAGLALVQVVLETALYLALAAGVARAGAWFARPAVRRRLEAVSGSVLVALGIRVAASGR
jgi:threonine/homoserine/homoserine lactone efflux protein